MSEKEFFAKVREQFPALKREFRGKRMVYLDTAATALKPEVVSKRINDYYRLESANVHRGAYALSDEATRNFEAARIRVAKFINALPEEIVFTRNTTESINLVASSWGESNLKAGDSILITQMEHHANIVPWQLLAEKVGANIQAVGLRADHSLDEEVLLSKLKAPVKLLSLTGCSNTLGVLPNLKKIIEVAHAQGILVLVDAAQLITQEAVDVRALGADFLVFSGHKVFGPTGIGILFGKHEILKSMPPYQGGGSMISQVSIEKTTFNDVPFRFEAGTPHLEGAIGLAAAIDFFAELGFDRVHSWENHLLKKATEGLRQIPGITIYADVPEKAAILSFNLKGAHPSDVGQILDQQGVAVRAGHHCTQPLMAYLKVPGTVRASFSIYNNEDDVELFLQAVRKAQELLS